MALGDGAFPILKTGSSGNQTSAGLQLGDSYEQAVMRFVIETASGGPAVTFKFQGSLDGSVWADLPYVTDSSDVLSTAAVTPAPPVAGTAYYFFSVRPWASYRVIVSGTAGTLTYRAEAFTVAN